MGEFCHRQGKCPGIRQPDQRVFNFGIRTILSPAKPDQDFKVIRGQGQTKGGKNLFYKDGYYWIVGCHFNGQALRLD